MTDLQRHFVRVALELLGESTLNNYFCESKRWMIAGINTVSIRAHAVTQDLMDIDRAVKNLMLHTDLDGGE